MKKVLIMLFLLVQTICAQDYNQPFPRTSLLQWGGGTPEYLSRFQLVITRPYDNVRVKRAKMLNPKTIFLATTDWVAGEILPGPNDTAQIPDAWRVRSSTGVREYSYSPLYLTDVTDYCPRINGETCREAMARIMVDETDWTAFDGINSDGTWSFPYGASKNIDLDRNGLPDLTEPGKGQAWIRQTWQNGVRAMMRDIRARLLAKFGNANAKLIAYWSGTDTMGVGIANGMGWENAPDHGPTVANWLTLVEQWEKVGPLPRINYVCAAVRYDSLHAPPRKKDHFRFVRWMLGATLMTDSYFMVADDAGSHWYNFYYEEFDAELGYPTGKAQRLANGCYVRFFDKGVVIVNPTNTTQIVLSDTLISRPGYAGPYYRFKGNQAPLWNDGSKFISVTLVSTPASWPNNIQNVGDAIILLKEPRVVVSDIIVDNSYSGTSAGSSEALTIGMQRQNGRFQSSNVLTWPWMTHVSGEVAARSDTWLSMFAPAGVSARATYTPGINIPGTYQVYEWHGAPTDTNMVVMATSVSYIVSHSKGRDTLKVNQKINSSRWNNLGKFDLAAGATVTITNAASGIVQADALKFVYVPPCDSSYWIKTGMQRMWDAIPASVSTQKPNRP